MDGADQIVWEHGRRNFSLRADGVLSIVCPVLDGSTGRHRHLQRHSGGDAVRSWTSDPGVQAGVFVYELHPCRSFPGDALPV